MNNCEIVRDLLPLYKDMVLNPSSVEMVEEHLKSCKDCVNELSKMQGDIRVNLTSEQDAQIGAFRLIKKKMFKRNIVVACTAIAVAIIMGLGAYLYSESKTDTTFLYRENETLVLQGASKQSGSGIAVLFESTSGPTEIALTLYVKLPGDDDYSPLQDVELITLGFGETSEISLPNDDCQYRIYAAVTEGANGNVLLRWN